MRVPSKISLYLLAFLSAFLILVLLAWEGARTQRALIDANESVQHSLEVITATQAMFSSLQDIETGERGYVITGVDSYLEPYLAARTQLAAQRQHLAQLLRKSGSPRAGWTSELDELIERRLSISDSNIDARMDTGLTGAAQRLLNAGGKQTMDQLRVLFAEAETAERAMLTAQDLAVAAQVRQARRIARVGGLLAAALFVWAIWLVHRSQKRLDDQRAFLRSVVDADDNYIFVTSARGRLMLCNESFARLAGNRPINLQGASVDELRRIDAIAPLFHGHDQLLGGRDELRLPEVDLVDTVGRHIGVQVYKRALERSAGNRMVLTVAVDISSRREMERMKNEFISTVSHELRTPLTAIRGALGMLVSGMLGSVGEQQKPLLDIAHKNSERLVRLINDILDIEKLASGRLMFNLSSQPLMPLMEQALSTTLPYAREYEVQLELLGSASSAEAVVVDADRFAQVMANLLSNAIKHSPRGGLVTINVGADPSGELVEISVIDRGAGVPVEFRERIFERFAQADSSNVRQLGGTGLGLAITRSLVEQMHGSVGFESEPGQGSRFYVRLPRAQLGDSAASPAVTSTPASHRLRSVLVLEPDDRAADFLIATLERQGYRALLARTASEARRMLADTPVHALTLSPALRDEDCIAFLRNLREQSAFRHLPILVVSLDTGPTNETSLRGSAVGVMDWLHKPIDPTRVLDVVRAILRPAGERPSILHIEDDADLRLLLNNLLAPLDVDVIGVGSLAEARRALSSGHHDLAILDLMLPDGDGSELINQLAMASPPTPVIIFSALDSPISDSGLVLKRLVKSRHDGAELAALIQQLLQHWPSVQDGFSQNKENP